MQRETDIRIRTAIAQAADHGVAEPEQRIVVLAERGSRLNLAQRDLFLVP